MGRGRGSGHKGGRKQFTNPEELAARQERYQREKAWKQQRGQLDSSESDDDDDNNQDGDDESEDGTSGSESGEMKAKGVEGLIEVCNPNRMAGAKPDKRADLTSTSDGSKVPEVQLSRREREEIERQKAKENYDRLHAEGKTDQARADLARLALIRQQREDAAKKKEAEKHHKDSTTKTAALSKTAATKSALTSINSTTGDTASGPSGASTGAKKKTTGTAGRK